MKFIANAVVKHKNNLYVMSKETSMILKMDYDSLELSKISFVPEEIFEDDLFVNIKVWKDKLILIPYNARNIWIVDEELETWKKIVINCNREMLFAAAEIIGDKLYVFKHNYESSGLCVDLLSGISTDLDLFSDDFFVSSTVYDGKIVLPSANSSNVYFFDPGNDVVDIQEIGSGSNYVTQNDNKLYFIPRNDHCIRCWDGKESKEYLNIKESGYCKNIFWFDNLVYMPFILNSETIRSYKYDGNNVIKWSTEAGFTLSIEISEGIQCLADLNANIYLFDANQKNIRQKKIEIDSQYIYQKIHSMKNICNDKKIFKEKEMCDLETFIQVIV